MRISDWSSDVCSSDLVLLRRILGELDGAVGAPVEPLRVLLDPGMVGRALDGEVEGDLQPVLGGRVRQAGEVVEVAELRMDRVVAAFLRADGRSEEHTSELQSLMRTSYAVFCLKKKNKTHCENSR